MARKPSRVCVRMSEYEHAFFTVYAIAKGHAGKSALSSLAHHSMYAQAARYKLTAKDIEEVGKNYPELVSALSKAQPDAQALEKIKNTLKE